jgi:hypothetical protein
VYPKVNPVFSTALSAAFLEESLVPPMIVMKTDNQSFGFGFGFFFRFGFAFASSASPLRKVPGGPHFVTLQLCFHCLIRF